MTALTTSLANWFDKPHAEPVVFLDSVSLCRNFFRSNGDRERGGDESRIGSNHRFEPIYAPFPSKIPLRALDVTRSSTIAVR